MFLFACTQFHQSSMPWPSYPSLLQVNCIHNYNVCRRSSLHAHSKKSCDLNMNNLYMNNTGNPATVFTIFMNNKCCVYGRSFKLQKNGFFLFGISFSCGSQKNRNDTFSVNIAMNMLLTPVSFYQKQISSTHFQPLKSRA